MSERRKPPPIVNDNPATPPPTREEREREMARSVDEFKGAVAKPVDDPLAGFFDGGGQGSASDDFLAGLVDLRGVDEVDPEEDYVADGTRLPRFVRAALQHEADLTKVKQQRLYRDIMLGRRVLSPRLLDHWHRKLYGKPWQP